MRKRNRQNRVIDSGEAATKKNNTHIPVLIYSIYFISNFPRVSIVRAVRGHSMIIKRSYAHSRHVRFDVAQAIAEIDTH